MQDKLMTVGVISVGNKRFYKRVADPGEIVKTDLMDKGFEITSYCVLPDDLELIKSELLRLCNGLRVDMVITTGGTGGSPVDCVPEATQMVADSVVSGLTESIRFYHLNVLKRNVLCRGISAVCNKTLIINLPDMPDGVCEHIDFLLKNAGFGFTYSHS